MMADTYWHKQSPDEPLFPDLLWSRPETKQQAGKLLIIGGNSFGFSAVGVAYMAASTTGVGTARVLLPEAIRKVVGRVLEHASYAASNPSGSFGKEALGELLEQAVWADGVLVAGDLGRNSETAILLEKFLVKHNGQVTLTKDAVDYCLATPKIALERKNTLLVLTMAQLQKLGTAARFDSAFRLGMDLLYLVDGLHKFTKRYGIKIIVKHHAQLVVAVDGQVSTTLLKEDLTTWRVKTAARASVWWLQNPDKPFQSLSTSITQID